MIPTSHKVIASAMFLLQSCTLAHAGDKDCLTKAVYHEAAAHASLQARLAIIQVVQNRVRKSEGLTVCDVVYAPYQFSWTATSKRLEVPGGTRWLHAQMAVEAYRYGARAQGAMGATHFHASYVSPKWASKMTRVAVLGGHYFFSQ